MSGLLVESFLLQSQWEEAESTDTGWFDRFNRKDKLEEEAYGWLRVCTRSGEHYETLAISCPMGVFLKEPIIPGCVCLQGLWVLHSTLCDNSPYVIYGEIEQEQCYQIDFNISIFIYLGDPRNISNSRTYVAPHSLTVFHEIGESKAPKIDFHWPSVISINPIKSIEATEEGNNSPVCFSKTEFIPKKKRIKAHIWDSALGPTTYKLVDSCKGKISGGYDDLVGTFNDFFYRSNKPVPIPFAPCSTQCTRELVTTSSTTPSSTTFFWSLKLKTGSKNTTNVFDNNTRRKREYGDNEEIDELEIPETVLEKPYTKSRWRRSNDPDPFPPNSRTTWKREKRYITRDTVDTTWDGMAFCMQSYWDPILKFEMSTTEEKWCYPEDKGLVTTNATSK